MEIPVVLIYLLLITKGQGFPCSNHSSLYNYLIIICAFSGSPTIKLGLASGTQKKNREKTLHIDPAVAFPLGN